MFTCSDIKNIAVQIEKNGEESYRRASTVVKDAQVAEALLWMAEQEKRHAQWFSSLQIPNPLSEAQKEMEEIGRTLLQDMIRGSQFLLEETRLEQSQTVREVLALSQRYEEETVLFYQFLEGLIEDEEDKQQLRSIINEEEAHALQIGDLIAALDEEPTDDLFK